MTIKPKHIIVPFILLGVVYLIFIMNMFCGNQEDLYKKEFHQTIVEIIPVRGRPLQKRVRLDDSTVMYLPDQSVPIFQVGDSLYKKPNEEYIYLKSYKNNKIYTTKIKNKAV
jgi:hypothetical protein